MCVIVRHVWQWFLHLLRGCLWLWQSMQSSMLGSMLCSCSLSTLDWAFPKNTVSVDNGVLCMKIVIWAGTSPWSGFGGAPSRPVGLSTLRQGSHVLSVLSWRCSAQRGGCTQLRDAKPSYVPRVVSTHGWASAIMFSETENNIHEPHVNLSTTNYSMSKKTYQNTPLSIYLHAFVEITLQGCCVNNQEGMAHKAKNISHLPSP